VTTRRVFLRSGALALVSFGPAPRALARLAASTGPRSRRGKLLVVVFQRGACDGLNAVVPYGEPAYRSLRPTIAIPAPRGGSREAALDLDGFFGLHPALAPLVPSWKHASLAVLHAVGSPHPTRSHFDAQDFMESGTPGRKSTEDGWLNRCLQARPEPGASPFRAVSLTPTLPRALQGRAPAVAVASLRDFAFRAPAGSGAPRAFEELYAQAGTTAVGATGQETFEALALLRSLDPAGLRPANGAIYPRGALGDALRQVAQLARADVGLEIAFVETGGWDHHAAEGGVSGQLANRLRELGGALQAFGLDLGSRMDDVVVATLTEFGRTARENGTRGTDHGHASVSFVLGGPVRGGRVLGRWPGLRADALHEGRDLAVTTDFRDLVAELAARHLGVDDLSLVLPGFAADPARFPGVLRG
jgi:uncharacterized protein (DUF1501 family)